MYCFNIGLLVAADRISFMQKASSRKKRASHKIAQRYFALSEKVLKCFNSATKFCSSGKLYTVVKLLALFKEENFCMFVDCITASCHCIKPSLCRFLHRSTQRTTMTLWHA